MEEKVKFQNIEVTLINEQVDRILDSSSFKNSTILARFLLFIVSETLKGKEAQLKEFVIATEVLKKNPDFDPQLSAIVRIHASRLRNTLDEYYKGEGAGDPVKISVPKGRYIPEFKIRHSDKKNESEGNKSIEYKKPVKPSIVVLPFSIFHENERLEIINSALVQDLSIELTRFPGFNVISNYSVQSAIQNFTTLNDLASRLGVDYVITGSCFEEGNHVHIKIGLNAINNFRLIWAQSYLLENYEQNVIAGYTKIVSQVIGAICGFFGLMTREILTDSMPEDYDYFYTIYWHNKYQQAFTEEIMREALGAIEKGLSKNPRSAYLTALKAEILINVYLVTIVGNEGLFKQAVHLANSAVEMDQNCQLGWEVLWYIDLFNGDKKSFMKNAEKVIAVNPNNAIHVGSAGWGYICVGEYETGIRHLSESIQLNPYYPWFYNLSYCWYYLNAKEWEEALYWANMVNRPLMFWDPMMRACTLAYLKKDIEARQAAGEILALVPEFPTYAKQIVGKFILDKTLINTILQGLILAGLDIPS